MDYKTMRYPGHCALMRLLMNVLKLNHDRATLKRVLENAVPQTLQDVVIVYIAVAGQQDGKIREETYVSRITKVIAGRLWSRYSDYPAGTLPWRSRLANPTGTGIVRQADLHFPT